MREQEWLGAEHTALKSDARDSCDCHATDTLLVQRFHNTFQAPWAHYSLHVCRPGSETAAGLLPATHRRARRGCSECTHEKKEFHKGRHTDSVKNWASGKSVRLTVIASS